MNRWLGPLAVLTSVWCSGCGTFFEIAARNLVEAPSTRPVTASATSGYTSWLKTPCGTSTTTIRSISSRRTSTWGSRMGLSITSSRVAMGKRLPIHPGVTNSRATIAWKVVRPSRITLPASVRAAPWLEKPGCATLSSFPLVSRQPRRPIRASGCNNAISPSKLLRPNRCCQLRGWSRWANPERRMPSPKRNHEVGPGLGAESAACLARRPDARGRDAMDQHHPVTIPLPHRARPFALVLVAILSIGGLTGCPSLTNPVAEGIPANRVPPEYLGRPREEEKTIPLTWLRQKQPEVYRLDAGDVLGIFIEGVLGDRNQVPPFHIGEPGSNLPPAFGFPIPVIAPGRHPSSALDSTCLDQRHDPAGGTAGDHQGV